MRHDMFEVIIERPRHRWGKRSQRPRDGRDRERIRRDPEGARTHESMRFHTGKPRLNENLAPLKRFLRSRVGRPWNEVHAEICAQIAPASAVQKHVLDHLDGFVETHTFLLDGEVWGAGRWGGPYAIGDTPYREQFYVCPTTGVLAVQSRPRVRRNRWWSSPDACWIDRRRTLRRIDGAWYLVHYAPARGAPSAPLDPTLRARLGATLFAQLEAYRARTRVEYRETHRTPVTAREVEALTRGAAPPPAPRG